MVRVFLPYIELLWRCMPAPLEEIKEAGFDGVECHLIGKLRSPECIKKVREKVAELGLGIRFHQGWSWETGQRNLYNVVLRLFGALAPVGMSLADQVRDVGTDPMVIYGNLVGEQLRSNYLYQTASERIHGRFYAMAFPNFVSAVKSSKLPVVFDTQHVLEWFLNKKNVASMPTAPATIKQMIDKLWQEFRPFVGEIHLCDFNPHLGPSRGMNVFPGDGVFPLAEFCAVVNASSWNGIVTPEVSFQHLQENGKLRMLREKVRRLFLT